MPEMSDPNYRARRLASLAFVTLAGSATAALMGVWLWARTYDFYLTPRFTHYNIMLWGTQQVVAGILVPCLVLAVPMLVVAPNIRWRWGVAFAAAFSLLAIVACH